MVNKVDHTVCTRTRSLMVHTVSAVTYAAPIVYDLGGPCQYKNVAYVRYTWSG